MESLESQRLRRALTASLFGGEERMTLGRFRLTECLGRGGMGIVYRAHDPSLDRDVALKILDRRGSEVDEIRQKRLRTEAKAMAKLSHRHVLTVHEVGEVDGHTYIAMEYCRAGTLAGWCEKNPPGTRGRFRRALRFALQAASGLSAAHAAGLVHRDLKPANFLLTDDDDLVVADFGLARSAATETTAPPTLDGSEVSSEDLARLTATGEVVGTPAYMAPEQLRGEGDTKSDQFGFCAAFFETFYGQRAHPGDGLVELTNALVEGSVRPHKPGLGVPRRIHRVLLRGLDPDPGHRYPTIDALATALRRAASNRGRIALGLGAVAGAGAVALSYAVVRETECDKAAASLAARWGADRAALGAAIESTTEADGYAAAVLGRADDFVAQWTEEHAAACDAGLPADSARRRCLRHDRASFEAFAEVAGQSDEVGALYLYEAALLLPSPLLCRQADLVDAVPLSDSVELEGLLARARAQVRLHNAEEAAKLAEEVVIAAAESADHPLLSRAHEVWSMAENSRGNAAAAREHALETLRHAEAARLGILQVRGWMVLAAADRERSELDDAGFALERAESIAKSQRLPASMHAELVFDRATFEWIRGDAATAVPRYEEALDLYAEIGGEEHPRRAAILSELGDAYARVGREEEAMAAATEAVAMIRRLRPPDTSFAPLLANLANLHMQRGDEAAALAAFEEAASLLAAAPSPNHEWLLLTEVMIGQALLRLGRLDEARQRLRDTVKRARGARLQRATSGAEFILANLLLEEEAFDEAAELYAALPRAGKIPTIYDDVTLGVNHALALAGAGRSEEARALALKALEGVPSVETVRTATTRIHIGEVLMQSGDEAQARDLLSAGLKTLEAAGIDNDAAETARAGLKRVGPAD